MFTDSETPTPHNRYAAYNRTRKGGQRRVTENVKRNALSQINYLNKEFVSWDGEGGNENDGSHTYFLLASSDGATISRRDGIPTVAVFELWLNARRGVTNIIYGGNYDVNMVLRDLDYDSLRTLYQTGRVTWCGYRLEWRAGKSFSVRRGNRSFLVYDVLPFFQRSFVSACDEYLGTDWEYRDEIIREKANRGNFDWRQLGVISEYNKAELSTLVHLANELRERLFKVEIRVARWDGPGAIASALYKKHGTKSHIAETPSMVAEAGRYAYAGGRFEIIRKGHSDKPCYQYDIRSAYPSAIRYLPCLQHGTWIHRNRPTGIARFGMYRIEVVAPRTDSVTQPQPLWMRNKNGTVYFSEYAHGWYWSPEAILATNMGGCIAHESWEWEQECDHEPFSFVEGLYNKRAALKKAGDGAHVGLKLGLNSLYGKLAQQVGWDPGPPLKLPPYHSLEWAGYITSHCRANVYRAAQAAPDDIIAFETDAVFSRVPLNLPLSERLGEWDYTDYDSLTYLKSGMYFGTLSDESAKSNGGIKDVEKCRGINKGTITRDQVIDALRREARGESVALMAEQTRFIGLGAAMNTNMDKWRHWITSPRTINVPLNGKRIDLLDVGDTRKELNDGWKETQEGFSETDFSHPYEVEWIAKTEIANAVGDTLPDVRRRAAHDTYDMDFE
jgi:hypothetical protein